MKCPENNFYSGDYSGKFDRFYSVSVSQIFILAFSVGL